MKIIKKASIAAPAPVIFQCVTQNDLIPQWMDNVHRVWFTSELDPNHPVGTTFKQTVDEGMGIMEYDGRVASFDSDRHFSVVFGANRFKFRLTYLIAATGNSCNVTYQLETVELSFFMKMVKGMVSKMAEKMASSHIVGLKRFAETQAVPS